MSGMAVVMRPETGTPVVACEASCDAATASFSVVVTFTDTTRHDHVVAVQNELQASPASLVLSAGTVQTAGVAVVGLTLAPTLAPIDDLTTFVPTTSAPSPTPTPSPTPSPTSPCGIGTVLANGVCEAIITGCAVGAVLNDGICEPIIVRCAAGTTYDDAGRRCVPDWGHCYGVRKHWGGDDGAD